MTYTADAHETGTDEIEFGIYRTPADTYSTTGFKVRIEIEDENAENPEMPVADGAKFIFRYPGKLVR